ncbi:MAG: putative portal protein [Prokaryotic dsDNA virus sp.]|nr:MAG: putative portal protein [Prokaryotic dsDNA virus sp.]|tara:strand:+ start:3867 stop:5432 length:1566 start_codon:yes stop_codon:yes gene_type:complete
MKLEVGQLLQLAEKQFALQAPMKSLWQILGDNFYPERADFTITRNVGQEFADNLMDSYPLLIRRDLGNSLSAMLREGDWFKMGAAERTPDYAGTEWLQNSNRTLRKLMYHRTAGFVRASKEGDHDFVTFGQCVKSVELNRLHNGLLFRCWHMRDCAWFEDETGQVCGVIRNAKMSRRDLVSYFGDDKIHANIKQNLYKDPFTELEIVHMVIPTTMMGDDELASKFPYVSIWIDKGNKVIIEQQGMNHKMYVVPRFQTIAGSAYAYSPATTVGLSDARTLQAMTHTLMEAAERYARPPIIATANVVKSDVDLGPDGITWVDEAYDERLGGALRTIGQDRGGWPIGNAERERITETLKSAFFLNKLNLPDVGHEMTAYEVSERMKQFRRENLPLFAPIEAEDNGQTCELAFEIAMQNNMLGSPYDIPPSLRGANVEFKFESPLTSSENEQIANRYAQTRDMLAGAIELDPSIGYDIDLSSAIRDAVTGIGAPQRWLTSLEDAAEAKQAAEAQQIAMQAMESQG